MGPPKIATDLEECLFGESYGGFFSWFIFYNNASLGIMNATSVPSFYRGISPIPPCIGDRSFTP